MTTMVNTTRTAKEAYEMHQARTRLFDEEAKDSRCASLHQASGGGINGILADEMGLGKDPCWVAWLSVKSGVRSSSSLLPPTLNNWHQEFTRFVPKFKVLPYWGNPHDRKVIRKFWSQKTLYTQNAPFNVVITSYQLVVQNVKYFQRLWALPHFIMPTLFDSHEEFNEWFSKDIASHSENKSAIDENQLSRLHMILKPFMLRRIKKDVENEFSDEHLVFTCHSPGLMGHSDVLVHSQRSANSPILQPYQPTQPPTFLLTAMPRVTAVPMERYCDDRSAEANAFYPRCPGGVMALYPSRGWSYIRIPDKETLITGKLHTLDLLLCRLKA
ncbi:hypothetical protein J4Q44_G00341250 [Coregonus suidteri]|uniref:Chromatin-remodeling ATPase INO80 n=1 Tax=Coregonus suidteri TaxID=861788 RepID=A0AAN8KSW6_9TELE